MTEQNKDTPKTESDFKEMPKPEEFASLTPELQNALVEKFSETDTPGEESTEGQGKETVKETPAQKPNNTDWEKRYKDLQSEYTPLTEELKKLKETPEVKTPSEKRSKFDELKKDNPKAKDFFDKLEAAIDERVGEKVNPLSDRLDQDDAEINEKKFATALDSFLEGDLKELQPELEQIIAETVGKTKEDLIVASQNDPNLFRELRKELLEKHFDKVVEIKSRSKTDPKKRNQEIQDTGVSGKSKTSVPKGEEDLGVKDIRKLKTYAEQKAALDKQGAVDESAKVSSQW